MQKSTVKDVKKLSEEEAQKRLNELISLGDYSDEYQNCVLPQPQNKEAYTQNNHADAQEEYQVWKDLRRIMKPLVAWMK